MRSSDATRVRGDLTTLSHSWRTVLAHDAPNARPIVSALLKGRVTITPAAKNEWTISGEGTLEGLFGRTIYLQGWRPQREMTGSNGRSIAGFGPRESARRLHIGDLYCHSRLLKPIRRLTGRRRLLRWLDPLQLLEEIHDDVDFAA
jgi:hypothetical protein